MKVIKVIKSEKFNELYPAEKTKVLCENCRKEVEAPLHPDTPVWCSPCPHDGPVTAPWQLAATQARRRQSRLMSRVRVPAKLKII
jgi:hypothetical protein